MPVYIGAAIQPPVISSTSGDVVAELREAWIAACLEFDERRAEEVVTHALSLFPPELVCVDMLQEALSGIGELWYERHLTVQQEHFASALATRRLEALIASAPMPFRPDRIIVACPPHELHVFSTLIITLLLRRQGWDVLYLGADVPVEKLNETITTTNPSLVILVAQQLYTAATLKQAARVLMEMGTTVAFGGRIFNLLPHLSGRIPGHFLGESLSRISAEIERLVMHPTPPQTVDETPAEYLDALAQFRRALPLIEAAVMNRASGMDIQVEHLDVANESLSRGIRAALQLGDTQLLDYDIQWIEGLLINYELPPEVLHHYLRLYQEAVAEHMGQHDGIVTEMLEGLIQHP
jgi:methanogenic corrinoid protein MtbC1